MPKPKTKAASAKPVAPAPFVYNPFPGVADRRDYLLRWGYDPAWVEEYLARFVAAEAARCGYTPPDIPPEPAPPFNPFEDD